MFSYSQTHRCAFCDNIIKNNANMVRVINNKTHVCFHVFCYRKAEEMRMKTDKISKKR
jgi:hypothetical protein